jgi:hypothetical protein
MTSVGRARTGLIWLRQEKVMGSCEYNNEFLGFHKIQDFF